MRFVNTFSGGLDKDTTPTSYKPNNYYDARNFSIVVAEDLSSATLTNTKGVTTTITYDAGTTRKIVGLVETPTTLVIFIKGVGLYHQAMNFQAEMPLCSERILNMGYFAAVN